MFQKYYMENKFIKTLDLEYLCITLFSQLKTKTIVSNFINKLAIIIKKIAQDHLLTALLLNRISHNKSYWEYKANIVSSESALSRFPRAMFI